jgi:hypothetical protein
MKVIQLNHLNYIWTSEFFFPISKLLWHKYILNRILKLNFFLSKGLSLVKKLATPYFLGWMITATPHTCDNTNSLVSRVISIRILIAITTINKFETHQTLKSVAQLVRSWVCSPEITVRVSQTSGPLETYMVVNFRTREISRGARKLARTPKLN